MRYYLRNDSRPVYAMANFAISEALFNQAESSVYLLSLSPRCGAHGPYVNVLVRANVNVADTPKPSTSRGPSHFGHSFRVRVCSRLRERAGLRGAPGIFSNPRELRSRSVGYVPCRCLISQRPDTLTTDSWPSLSDVSSGANKRCG